MKSFDLSGDYMNKILISIEKEYITFSKYYRQINGTDFNNTNIIDVKNLKFTEDYILENIELVSTFVNLILLKFNINKVKVKSLDIAPSVLNLLKNINNIKYIKFTEDRELTYTISALLLENKNLEQIECYSLPNIMFYKFSKDQINTRSKILSTSNFLSYNKINTFSDLFNKEKIIIGEYITKDDVPALIYFLDNNKNLKKIEFKRYNRKNLEAVLFFLKKNYLNDISIIIHENEQTTQQILNDIKLFEKLSKENNVKIKIKYSKEYKEKNKVKEFNIILFKYIILTCIVVFTLLIICYGLLAQKSNKKINDNLNQINKVIEKVQKEDEIEQSIEEDNSHEQEQEETYISSYYQNYSKVYNELLSINSDTVGWLTVNGTKINYPVVQTIDNDYYLNHAYDKTKNLAGWIFVDYRNNMDKLSKNTIIYGHSMVNGGLMFSTLKNSLNSEWYNNENNLNINFSVKGQDITWRIFSIYAIEETTDYLYSDFKSEDSFIEFIIKLKARSIKNFNVDVNSDSKILTLSTCYNDDNHRVVVHAFHTFD